MTNKKPTYDTFWPSCIVKLWISHLSFSYIPSLSFLLSFSLSLLLTLSLCLYSAYFLSLNTSLFLMQFNLWDIFFVNMCLFLSLALLQFLDLYHSFECNGRKSLERKMVTIQIKKIDLQSRNYRSLKLIYNLFTFKWTNECDVIQKTAI